MFLFCFLLPELTVDKSASVLIELLPHKTRLANPFCPCAEKTLKKHKHKFTYKSSYPC